MWAATEERTALRIVAVNLVLNLFIGFGLVFVLLSVTALVRSTTENYGRLAEFITPYNENLNAAIARGAADPSVADGLARISVGVARQAGMLGFLDAFTLYTAACFAMFLMIPLFKIRKTA